MQNSSQFQSIPRSGPGLFWLLSHIAIPTVILFGTVYAFALTFVYIEGDDASSVVYHAMGRNRALQPPYSAYHGMMDIFLGLLPSNEVIVRHTAMAMTAIAAALMVILIGILIFSWLPFESGWRISACMILLLICSPEIFYMGLVYTPSLVAMSLVLAAHVMIRSSCLRKFRSELDESRSATIFLLSAVLFGVGVACRWDVGVYLLFVAADLLLIRRPAGGSRAGWRISAAWCSAAFAASLAAILVSGHGIVDIRSTLELAKKEVSSSDSWFATIGAYQTLFTPGFGAFFLIGVVFLFRKSRRSLLLIAVGVLSVAPYFFSREPKMILPALPALWLAVAAGINVIFQMPRDKFRWAMPILILLSLTPWVIGLRVNSAETAWGPGFEVKTGDRSAAANTSTILTNRVDERTVGVGKIRLGPTGGFAIPTPEGPRPLGGHFWVLFGGKWRELASELAAERERVVAVSTEKRYNILQDSGNSYIVAELLEKGYMTTNEKGTHAGNGVYGRVFTSSAGPPLTLQTLQVRKRLFEKTQLAELQKLNPVGKVMLYSGYTSTITKIAEVAPDSLEILGPFSAIVDITALNAEIHE